MTGLLRKTWQPMDPDAAAYIAAVEVADGQSLEEPVKIAIDNFILGCKADGIWPAIKASCILAGARTLAGCLVPLAGTAPTNFNFVAGDYNRKTGLKGDGSTKYLNSNRNNNADPQNSAHISVFGTQWGPTTASPKFLVGRQVNGFNERGLFVQSTFNSGNLSCRVQSVDFWASHGAPRATGFIGASRSNSSVIAIRNNSATVSVNQVSAAPSSPSLFVFVSSDDGGSPAGYDDSRLSFYSIGEALDLALLDARVTDLMNALGAAIP